MLHDNASMSLNGQNSAGICVERLKRRIRTWRRRGITDHTGSNSASSLVYFDRHALLSAPAYLTTCIVLSDRFWASHAD